MTFFGRDDPGTRRFRVLAGREHGLHRLVVASGTLGPGEGGPLHLHHGEEVLRIVSGEAVVTVGDETRRCGPGDVVIIPTDVRHGFVTLSEVTMDVVAETDAGQIIPVHDPDGTTRLVEVYRSDLPWGRTPPEGFGWTSDEDMAAIDARVDPPPSTPPRTGPEAPEPPS